MSGIDRRPPFGQPADACAATMDNPARRALLRGTVPWLNWIEQPPPKGQVAGSNPAGIATPLRNRQKQGKLAQSASEVCANAGSRSALMDMGVG